jgi:hypothetical protein
MNCRFCKKELEHVFVDLGHQPPSNAYLTKEQLSEPEVYYPLRVRVCHHCWLVQTEDYADRTAFFNHEYAYFSSTSTTWLQHAIDYVSMITKRLNLNSESFVVEIASNDGYLLKNFLAAKIPCLGIEPTDSTADAAEKLGIPVVRDFFGEQLAQTILQVQPQADLILGNNVYAHVPDILDFTKGIATLLKPQGVVTLEFPHLMQLVEHNQFDTIYHEHYSYLSLTAVEQVFAAAGLRIFDVEQLNTHGGSLRVYGCLETASYIQTEAVKLLKEKENSAGISSLDYYKNFMTKVEKVKLDLLDFLIQAKKEGKKVAAYGAAAKGNTLLNYCGIKDDLIDFVVDANEYKQGKFLPGSHLKIVKTDHLRDRNLNFIFILPWNLQKEISIFLSENFGSNYGETVTAIPKLSFLNG